MDATINHEPLTKLTAVYEMPRQPRFQLDIEEMTVTYGRNVVSLSSKAFSLLGVLVLARFQDSAWVFPQDIARQTHWISGRTPTSLRRQIRREITDLIDEGVDVIEWQTRMHGPFRLKFQPQIEPGLMARLSQMFSVGTSAESGDISVFAAWLHEAEKVLRADYSFDKSGDLFQEFQTPVKLQLDPCQAEPTGSASRTGKPNFDPLLKTRLAISQARRLRDSGHFGLALGCIDRAQEFAGAEDDREFRPLLIATCALHRGWIYYRDGAFRRAWKCAKDALNQTRERGFLQLKGQILVLHSLLYLRDGESEEAFRALWTAARHFLICTDPYNFFSVFHNLGCLVAEHANKQKDVAEQEHLWRQAAKLCSDSAHFCEEYGLGRNSALSQIKAASLWANFDLNTGLRQAEDAFRKALKIKAYSDAIDALKLCARLCLESRQYEKATSLRNEFLQKLPETLRKRMAEKHWQLLGRLDSAIRQAGMTETPN